MFCMISCCDSMYNFPFGFQRITSPQQGFKPVKRCFSAAAPAHRSTSVGLSRKCFGKRSLLSKFDAACLRLVPDTDAEIMNRRQTKKGPVGNHTYQIEQTSMHSTIRFTNNLEFPGILLTVASNDPRKFKGRWKSQIVPIHPYIFPLIFSTTFISINSSI